MQGGMNLKRVIVAATILALAYLVATLLRLPLQWIYALYGMSAVACLWMTIAILRDAWSTDRTFDDYFYHDRPDIRRVGKE